MEILQAAAKNLSSDVKTIIRHLKITMPNEAGNNKSGDETDRSNIDNNMAENENNNNSRSQAVQDSEINEETNRGSKEKSSNENT